MRADRIRAGFVGYAKGIEKRVKTTGVGSSQAIIGTGRDDASDALDRRVEFKIVKC
jgi:outer membrane protein OmpA-like peptidoglycan-associated protein